MTDEQEKHAEPEDVFLRNSAPPTAAISAEVLEELVAMARASRTASMPARLRRRVSRGTAAGLATVVISGFGAAAALTGSVWSEPSPDPVWLAGPHAVLKYETPGGEVCEDSVGAYRSKDPALNAAIENLLVSVDLAALIDVDAAIQEMRQEERIVVTEREQEVDGSYGTQYYPDPESEYRSAVSRAVSKVMHDELGKLGFTQDELAAADLQSEGFGICEGDR